MDEDGRGVFLVHQIQSAGVESRKKRLAHRAADGHPAHVAAHLAHAAECQVHTAARLEAVAVVVLHHVASSNISVLLAHAGPLYAVAQPPHPPVPQRAEVHPDAVQHHRQTVAHPLNGLSAVAVVGRGRHLDVPLQ